MTVEIDERLRELWEPHIRRLLAFTENFLSTVHTKPWAHDLAHHYVIGAIKPLLRKAPPDKAEFEAIAMKIFEAIRDDYYDGKF